MPKQHILALATLASALFAAPAMADGQDRARIIGPTPLQPHAQITCEHGQYADGRCYVPQQQQTVVRRVVQPAPRTQTVRRVAQPVRAAAPSYDFSGFGGGVGSSVGGGHGGGGGVIVINNGRSYSGIRSSAISHFTFGGFSGGNYGGSGGCN